MINKRIALIGAFICFFSQALAESSQPEAKLIFQHGIATFGTPDYGKNFEAFAYVNPNAPLQGTFRLGVMGSFDSLNPYLLKGDAAAGLSFLEGNLLHASLFKKSEDEPFSSYGYLAEGVHISSDKRRITFRLRAEAIFHDGSAVFPEDVIFTFTYLQQKGLPFFKSYYKAVERVVQSGPRDVTFILRDTSSPELASILGQLPVLPKRFYQGAGGEKGTLTPPLGSGPYRVKDASSGKRIVYERVQNWWGDKVPAIRGLYRFKTISYDYFRDHAILVEAFKRGQLDFLMLSSKQAVVLRNFQAVKEGKLLLRELPHRLPYGHVGFIFNLRRQLFQSRDVRQALGLVFDFDWVNQHLLEKSRARVTSFFTHSEFAATGPLPPEERAVLEPFKAELDGDIFEKPMSTFVDGGLADGRQRRRKALELLRKTGWILEKGKLVHQQTRRPFKFTFLLIAGTPFEKIVAHYKEILRTQLGITMDVRLVDTSTFEIASRTFDFDMIFEMIPGSYNLGNELWDHFGSHQAKQEGSQNKIGIRSPVVDQLIRVIIAAKSYDVLRVNARALDRVLMSGFYSVPGFYPPKLQVAYWKRVQTPRKLPQFTGVNPMAFWLADAE